MGQTGVLHHMGYPVPYDLKSQFPGYIEYVWVYGGGGTGGTPDLWTYRGRSFSPFFDDLLVVLIPQ